MRQFLSAIIEENVSIGDGTKVWYYSHICTKVKMGRDCVIGERTYIGEGVILGDNVKVGNGVNIYSGTVIKDGVFIGNNTSFTNVRKPMARKVGKRLDTIVEEGASIGANSTIVGGVKIGKNAIVADGAVVVGNVPDNAWANGNPAKVKIRND